MANGRTGRGLVRAAALVVALAAASLAAAAPAAHARPQRPAVPVSAQGVLGWLVDTAVCGTLTKSATVEGTAAILGDALKLKGLPASMFETTVLAGVQVGCTWAVSKVTKAMPLVLGRSGSSRLPTTRVQFTNLLGSVRAAQVSTALNTIGWRRSTTDVVTVTGALCSAVHGGNPYAVLSRWFPRAVLDSLPALNGLVGVALDQCTLTGPQIAYLSSSITSYVAANVANDVTPPVTTITVTGATPLTNGRVQIGFHWLAHPFFGRVQAVSVWVHTASGWTQLNPNQAFTLGPRQPYYMAARAEDTANHWGAWAFTPWLVS